MRGKRAIHALAAPGPLRAVGREPALAMGCQPLAGPHRSGPTPSGVGSLPLSSGLVQRTGHLGWRSCAAGVRLSTSPSASVNSLRPRNPSSGVVPPARVASVAAMLHHPDGTAGVAELLWGRRGAADQRSAVVIHGAGRTTRTAGRQPYRPVGEAPCRLWHARGHKLNRLHRLRVVPQSGRL